MIVKTKSANRYIGTVLSLVSSVISILFYVGFNSHYYASFFLAMGFLHDGRNWYVID